MAESSKAWARHETMVAGQFGPQADAYVASRVHAEGDDLARIAAIAAARPGGASPISAAAAAMSPSPSRPIAGEVVACDLSAEMLAAVAAEAARRGLGRSATRQASVAALPFEDAAFDMVMSRFSAHHWDDVGAGPARGPPHREARRASPSSPMWRRRPSRSSTHFLQAIELLRDPSHVRNLTVAAWCASVAAAGFSVTAVSTGRLRLDFASWIARIGTPPLHAAGDPLAPDRRARAGDPPFRDRARRHLHPRHDARRGGGACEGGALPLAHRRRACYGNGRLGTPCENVLIRYRRQGRARASSAPCFLEKRAGRPSLEEPMFPPCGPCAGRSLPP